MRYAVCGMRHIVLKRDQVWLDDVASDRMDGA